MKARAIASIVAVGLMTASIAGCTFVTPIATHAEYDPSDGINVTVGKVKLLNAIVLTDDGRDGNLIARAYNGSSETVTLTLQYDVDGQQTLTRRLGPNSTTDLGYGSAGQVFLPEIGTEAGGLLPLYIQYGSEQGQQVQVPVLDNALPQYKNLLPTPTPTPTPSRIPVLPPPVGTPTPTPSATR